MSLSAEEETLLESLIENDELHVKFRDGEAIWNAAKNYWLEQAAKACEAIPDSNGMRTPDWYGAIHDCASEICALKDQHG